MKIIRVGGVMKYTFRDILNEEIYNNCSFCIVAGSNYIFTNMIIDTFKDILIKDTLDTDGVKSVSNDFNLPDDSKASNYVDLDTFRQVIGSPSINGKWFCICDYKTLSKNQKGYIEMYKRSPSKLGMILVYSTDYKDYKSFLKDNVLNTSRASHLFDLRYIHVYTLKQIVMAMFETKGRNIDVNALEYFIVKVGRAYDNIEDMVDSVIEESKSKGIGINEVKNALKNVENFTIDDFVQELLSPLRNSNTSNKKVYRMMVSMIEEYGCDGTLRKLSYEINNLTEFRKYINNGTIPVSISYLYSDCIKKIGNNSRISKYAEHIFRRKALLAAQTSLEDLVYIKMIINSAISSYKEEVCYRALYAIVSRSVLSEDRINNIVGITNIIESEYTYLDKYVYIDSVEE